MTVEELVYAQSIRRPYQYTAGPAQRAFLRGLAERRIVGSRAGGRVLVPARPFDETGQPTGELVEVASEGEVVAWTTAVAEGVTRTFGLIRLDGADTPLLHLLDVPEAGLAPGLRVRARWAEPREAEITAIEAFEPA